MNQTINIRVKDTSSGYIARHKAHSASATCSAHRAVRRCAAKALGLCPARKPADVPTSLYFNMVESAALRIVALSRLDGTYDAFDEVARRAHAISND